MIACIAVVADEYRRQRRDGSRHTSPRRCHRAFPLGVDDVVMARACRMRACPDPACRGKGLRGRRARR